MLLLVKLSIDWVSPVMPVLVKIALVMPDPKLSPEKTHPLNAALL